jgi:hypothetical protein
MVIIENPKSDQERSLEVEMGPEGFLEINCPVDGFYFYKEWSKLSKADQAYFEVILCAHSRLITAFCKQCKVAEGNGKCSKTG